MDYVGILFVFASLSIYQRDLGLFVLSVYICILFVVRVYKTYSVLRKTF